MPITIDGTTGIQLTGNAGLTQTGNGQIVFNEVSNLTIGNTSSLAGSKLTSVGGIVQLSGGTTSQEGIRIQRTSGAATITGINNSNNAYNNIAFFTSATEAVRIDTGGNVGIGTTTTGAAKFGIVSGNSPSYAGVLIGYLGSANYFDANTQVFRNGAFTETMRIDSSGNLGIGTNLPSFGLSVVKDNGSGYAAGFRKDASSAWLMLQTFGTIPTIQGLTSTGGAVNDIGLQSTGGNVAIGRASATYKLDVNGTVNASAILVNGNVYLPSRLNTIAISANTTAVSGGFYVATTTVNLTLPASPTVGDIVGLSNMSGNTNLIVSRNGANILGIAEDLTFDKANAAVIFQYSGASKGWVFV